MPRAKKNEDCAQKAGPGAVKYDIHRQRGGKAHVQQAVQGYLWVAVRPAAQQGLGKDAGQTPDGGEHAGLAAGKAPAQKQSGLVAGKGGE